MANWLFFAWVWVLILFSSTEAGFWPLPAEAGFWPLPAGAVFWPLPVGVLVSVTDWGTAAFAAALAGSNATLIPKTVTPSRTETTPTFNFRRP